MCTWCPVDSVPTPATSKVLVIAALSPESTAFLGEKYFHHACLSRYAGEVWDRKPHVLCCLDAHGVAYNVIFGRQMQHCTAIGHPLAQHTVAQNWLLLRAGCVNNIQSACTAIPQ